MSARVLLSLALALALALAGCAAAGPQRPLGGSVRRAVAAQTLNPEAGGAEPVAGLDGQAGERVMQGYREGFAAERKDKGADVGAALPGEGGKK